MDETQMMEFVSQAVADVGALLGGAMVAGVPEQPWPQRVDPRPWTALTAWLAAGARSRRRRLHGHGRPRCCWPMPAPASAVTGFDAHDGSVRAHKQRRRCRAGRARTFQVASAPTFSGSMTWCASSTACMTWAILSARALTPAITSPGSAL